MKLVLQKDIDDLGSAGDVVKVKPGYARNFLLPRAFAVPATSNNLKRVEKLKAETARRHTQLKADAEGISKRLAEVTLTVERRVGEEGKLYGSVTTIDIAEGLKTQGFDIPRKNIQIGDPIRTVGDHKVKIRLFKEISAEITVHVKSDEKA